MMLTAWAEGVGSNWVGFMGMTDVKPVLGIPDEFDVLAIIPFGYPVKAVGKGRKKSQGAFRGRPPRAVRPAVSMIRL
jgi:nitroreductase